MQTEKDRILELRKALEYHNYKYYIENAPEISDREFDGLMHDLEKLEEKYPEMYDPNSPTQRLQDQNDYILPAPTASNHLLRSIQP